MQPTEAEATPVYAGTPNAPAPNAQPPADPPSNEYGTANREVRGQDVNTSLEGAGQSPVREDVNTQYNEPEELEENAKDVEIGDIVLTYQYSEDGVGTVVPAIVTGKSDLGHVNITGFGNMAVPFQDANYIVLGSQDDVDEARKQRDPEGKSVYAPAAVWAR